MKSIKRVRNTQPATKKKVIELEIGGWLGRLFTKHNWGAFTYPLPFLVFILYWTDAAEPDGNVHPLVRVHEFQHVAQDERNAFFLVTWFKYFWSSAHHLYWRGWSHVGEMFMDAYYANDMEVEAYKIEEEAEKNGLPPWAL